jgi:hypothetical protein
MKDMYTVGRKSVYTKWLITAAFAIAVVCLSSLAGASNVNAQTVDTKPTSNNTTNTCGQTAESQIGPSTNVFYGGGYYRGFDGTIGFGYTNGITIVDRAKNALVTMITGQIAPTVAVDDVGEIQPDVQSPCIGTAPAKQ